MKHQVSWVFSLTQSVYCCAWCRSWWHYSEYLSGGAAAGTAIQRSYSINTIDICMYWATRKRSNWNDSKFSVSTERWNTGLRCLFKFVAVTTFAGEILNSCTILAEFANQVGASVRGNTARWVQFFSRQSRAIDHIESLSVFIWGKFNVVIYYILLNCAQYKPTFKVARSLSYRMISSLKWMSIIFDIDKFYL